MLINRYNLGMRVIPYYIVLSKAYLDNYHIITDIKNTKNNQYIKTNKCHKWVNSAWFVEIDQLEYEEELVLNFNNYINILNSLKE